jgi:hypothetical protein
MHIWCKFDCYHCFFWIFRGCICIHSPQHSFAPGESMAAVPWSDLDMARTLRPESFDGRGRPRRISPRVRFCACMRLTTLCYYPSSQPLKNIYIYVCFCLCGLSYVVMFCQCMHVIWCIYVCLHFKCPSSKPR